MFVIRMLDPQRRQFYFPASGSGGNTLTRELDDAATFKTKPQAQARLTARVSPPAFWESEHAHAAAIRRFYKGWRFFIMDISEDRP